VSERDALALGLRLMGAWFCVGGILAAPGLYNAVGSLPPDLAIPELLRVTFQVLVGLRLTLKGGAVASWIVRRDPAA